MIRRGLSALRPTLMWQPNDHDDQDTRQYSLTIYCVSRACMRPYWGWVAGKTTLNSCLFVDCLVWARHGAGCWDYMLNRNSSSLPSHRSQPRNLIAWWAFLRRNEASHSLFPPYSLWLWHECLQAHRAYWAPRTALDFLEMGQQTMDSTSVLEYLWPDSGLLPSFSACHSLQKAGLETSGIQP